MTNQGPLNTSVEYSTQTHTQIILIWYTETSQSPIRTFSYIYQTLCLFGTNVTLFKTLFIERFHTSAFS